MTGFKTFLNNILRHRFIQRQVGDEPLELRVLVKQLLELARLARQHPPVDLLPAIERLLGDSDLAADVADGHASCDLLQDRRNLLNGKALSLHGTPSWPVGRIVPRNSRAVWTEKPGAPHND